MALLASETGVRAASAWTMVGADEGEDPALGNLARRQELWRPGYGANARARPMGRGSPPDHSAVLLAEIFGRRSRDGRNSRASMA